MNYPSKEIISARSGQDEDFCFNVALIIGRNALTILLQVSDTPKKSSTISKRSESLNFPTSVAVGESADSEVDTMGIPDEGTFCIPPNIVCDGLEDVEDF